jgi:hypothetical protein
MSELAEDAMQLIVARAEIATAPGGTGEGTRAG